jgi:hypothetical protein
VPQRSDRRRLAPWSGPISYPRDVIADAKYMYDNGATQATVGDLTTAEVADSFTSSGTPDWMNADRSTFDNLGRKLTDEDLSATRPRQATHQPMAVP